MSLKFEQKLHAPAAVVELIWLVLLNLLCATSCGKPVWKNLCATSSVKTAYSTSLPSSFCRTRVARPQGGFDQNSDKYVCSWCCRSKKFDLSSKDFKSREANGERRLNLPFPQSWQKMRRANGDDNEQLSWAVCCMHAPRWRTKNAYGRRTAMLSWAVYKGDDDNELSCFRTQERSFRCSETAYLILGWCCVLSKGSL